MPPSPIWATSVSCPLDRARTSVQAKSRAESPRLSAAARMRWRASSTHVRTVSAEGRADAVSRGCCRDDAVGVDAAARWRRAAWRIVRQVMRAPCRPWLALPAPSHVTATNHSASQVWLSLLTGTTAQAWASCSGRLCFRCEVPVLEAAIQDQCFMVIGLACGRLGNRVGQAMLPQPFGPVGFSSGTASPGLERETELSELDSQANSSRKARPFSFRGSRTAS